MEINKNIFRKTFEGKKVLVTGDTGFKGSWLSIWLHELGAKVYGYSLPPKTQNDNYVECNLQKRISHTDADVRNLESLKKYFSETQPDFAFHLAAQALVLDSYDDPHNTFETNLMGTVIFFEAVRQTPSVKCAINVTSDKCYKNKEQIHGYKEEDEMGGNDPYSASKGCSELISHSYMFSFFNEKHNCKIATARAGNVIGGGDWADNRIVPDFFRAVMGNGKLIIRNPHATRPWQHVLEPLSGYLWLCAKLYHEGDKYCGNWNFGPHDTNNSSVEYLIKKLIGKYGKGSFEIPEIKDKPHESILLKLDISKALNLLQWKPVLNFDETIALTAEGYSDKISNENIYESRVNQINKYISKAESQGLIWTK